MKHVNEFIEFALSHAKKSSVPAGAKLAFPVGTKGEWEYLYGTTGKKCTTSLLTKKYNSYYARNNWSRTSYNAATRGWVERGVIVCDCQGLEDYFSHADTNAKGNYANYCTKKGKTSEINRKYVIGEAVFKGNTPSRINHVGWICGFMPDGEPLVVEEKGLKYGCVVTKLSATKWTYRGLMTKRYKYDSVEVSKPEVFTFDKTLRVGMRDNDVKEMKKLLVKAGYTNLDVTNNYFGSETKATVLKFQKSYFKDDAEWDGVFGRKTCEALGGRWK